MRTVNYIRTVARIALNVAVEDELLERNVAILTKAEKARKTKASFVVNPLTVEEITVVSEQALAEYNGLFIVVAAFLGLRRGELCGLKWQDFNEPKALLLVERQVLRYGGELHVDEVKTAKSHRVIACHHFWSRS